MSVHTIDPSESEDLLDSSEDDGQSDSRKRPRVAFQDRLKDPPKTSTTPVPSAIPITPQRYHPEEHEFTSIPDEADEMAQSADTYASFGDEGTTATVNMYGKIIQITQYLGNSPSGFFSVDLSLVPEPYYVKDRAQELMALRASHFGICPYFETGILSEPPNERPALEFLRDRWPRVTAELDGITSVHQFFVRNSTIFDVWTFHPSKEAITITGDLVFDLDLLIRELDFVHDHKFNGESLSDSSYSAYLGPQDQSAIVRHSGSSNDGIKDAVGLCIALFLNGTRLALQIETDSKDFPQLRIKLPENCQRIPCPGTMEITTAFRMQSMPKGEDILVPRHVDLKELYDEFASLTYTKLTFSNDVLVDFAIRRNLEHILSVCSIPVWTGNHDSHGITETEVAVGLTCGDVSGHRLVTSASFPSFAFQFLLSILEHLVSACEPASAGACRILRNRILRIRRAHVVWLCKLAKRSDGCYAANYWASGAEIRGADSSSALAAEALSDTPYQIIKLADFISKTKDSLDEDMRDFVKEHLRSLVGPWLRKLDEADKRGHFAFPQPGTQKYRLEYHVWIWRALLAIDNLRVVGSLKGSGTKTSSARDQVSQLPLGDFSPAEIQRKVLKRFTTENTASRRRMIAVSRKSAETRFLFRSRDTVLFYESKPPFFDKSDSLWKATIDAQRYHEENEDSTWDNPLRYGLALMMAAKGFQINWKSAQRIFDNSRATLLMSSSSNGLFPGQMNKATKESELFYYAGWRDFYWHVGFEIPYILWTHGRVEPIPSRPREFQGLSWRGNGLDGSPARQRGNDDPTSERSHQAHLHSDVQLKEYSEMKKKMPFNNLIDQKSIVELPDEWLYNYPDFLDFNPDMEDLSEAIEHNESDTGKYISDAIGDFTRHHPEERSPRFLNEYWKGSVIDVPKSAQTKVGKTSAKAVTLEENIKIYRSQGMYMKLKSKRVVQDSKKRLIWLPNLDLDTALLCFLSSPESERAYVSSFFDRHTHQEKFFSDDATAALNLWKTEFHLSYYRLLDRDERSEYNTLSFLGDQRQELKKAAIGFLFIGDFFDRYWTCRVCEHDPQQNLDNSLHFEDNHKNEEKLQLRLKDLIKPKLPGTDQERRPWRQRKVLELLIFDHMLEAMKKSYNDMTQDTSKHLIDLFPEDTNVPSSRSGVLAVSNALFSSPMDNDTYLRFSKDWPPFQYTLQVMEDDLKENIEKIALWRTREKDREPERPRWTRNDERKYRSAITRLSISNNQKVRDLERHLSNIQSLRMSLTSRLESTRNELSFQSAENVRFFTYVTVVFLPLGFATAIFSMNDTPMSAALIGMVITAVIALFLTIVALVNAQRLDQKVFRPILQGSRALKRLIRGLFPSEKSSAGSDEGSQDGGSSSRSFGKLGEGEGEDGGESPEHKERFYKPLFQKIKRLRNKREDHQDLPVVDEMASDGLVRYSRSG